MREKNPFKPYNMNLSKFFKTPTAGELQKQLARFICLDFRCYKCRFNRNPGHLISCDAELLDSRVINTDNKLHDVPIDITAEQVAEAYLKLMEIRARLEAPEAGT